MLSKNAMTIYGMLSVSGKQTAAELMSKSKLSQPMISRALQEISIRDNALAAIRQGRTIVYALRKQIRGLPMQIPIYQIAHSAKKKVASIGTISALSGGGFVVDEQNGASHISDALPWFLQDLKPQGYLGRAFCHSHAARLGLSANLNEWSDEDTLLALAMLGSDMPSNLVLGQASREQISQTAEAQPERYDELADESVSGTLTGSSAGGEHPKFVSGNCIVKFSPIRDGSQVAQRWCDLLVAEYCATLVLLAHDFPAPVTRIIQTKRRCYLESVRYDRVGGFGRVGVVAIGALDDEFVGERKTWSLTAQKLGKLKMLDEKTVDTIGLIEQFGRLIGNTDMHFGNLSFFVDHPYQINQLMLAPVYDMLPMRYAPEKGELVTRSAVPIERDHPFAIQMARTYWLTIKKQKNISVAFRTIADENLVALNAALNAALDKL